MNSTGAFLWQLLADEQTAETLLAALLAEYDVDRETAEQHAVAFVEKLKGLNFLE